MTQLGTHLTLSCKLDPTSTTLQFWLSEGQSNPIIPGSDGTLTISSLTTRETGWYSCCGISDTGSAVSVAWIGLKEGPPPPPPIIQLGPVNQTLEEGDTVVLHCQFTATREKGSPQVVWLKEGVPIDIDSSQRFFLNYGHNLQMKSLKLQDSGLYTCQIRSTFGQSSVSAYLVVLRKKDGVGLIRPPDLVDFPASPSKPELIRVDGDSITVKWGKPHRVGSSPLRGYQLEYVTSGSLHWVSSQVQGEQFTLDGIEKGVAVSFLVRARNEHGLSPPSPLSDQLTTDGGKGGRARKRVSG